MKTAVPPCDRSHRVVAHVASDAKGRPLTRTTSRGVQSVTDSFGYNNRSELTTATVNNGAYAYDYDNIGNRKTAQENAEEVTGYTANELNQYTAISVDSAIDFAPEYDADGNQTRVKTSTGIWAVNYDSENRPIDFYRIDSTGGTTVHCTYEHMGRLPAHRPRPLAIQINGTWCFTQDVFVLSMQESICSHSHLSFAHVVGN